MPGLSVTASRWRNRQPRKAVESLMPLRARRPRGINTQGPRRCGHLWRSAGERMQLILPHTPRVEDPSALTGPGRGACASAGRLGGRARSVRGPRLLPPGGADTGQAAGGVGSSRARVTGQEGRGVARGLGDEGQERWRPILKPSHVTRGWRPRALTGDAVEITLASRTLSCSHRELGR